MRFGLKFNLRSYLLSFALGLTMVVGFQNCSGVRMNGTSSGSSSLAKTDGTVNTLPSPGSTDVTTEAELDPSLSCTHSSLPAADSTPLSGQSDLQNLSGPNQVHDLDRLSLTNVSGRLRVENVTEVTQAQDLSGDIQISSQQLDSLVNFSGFTVSSSQSATLVQNGHGSLQIATADLGQLLDFQGKACVSFQHAKVVQNIQGALRLQGSADGSTRSVVDLVLDTNGPLYLENVEVKMLQNHRGGPVILVNSVIDQQLDVSQN